VVLAERLAYYRKRRRKLVKRYGRRAMRRLNGFLAAQSLVPTEPILDARLFPWIGAFEENWKTVRGELDRVLEHRESLPKFYEVNRDQKRIAGDDHWKTFVFIGFQFRSEVNCRLCPETWRLLQQVPRLETAFFSILAPGAHIPRHHGVPKGLIRCHLPLMVPRKRQDCVMWVNDVPQVWEEGKALVFDDTYPHEVRNATDESRVVLLFDFERPMRPFGRLAHRSVLAAMRRTAFVRDSLKAHRQWEEMFEQKLEDDEDDPRDSGPS